MEKWTELWEVEKVEVDWWIDLCINVHKPNSYLFKERSSRQSCLSFMLQNDNIDINNHVTLSPWALLDRVKQTTLSQPDPYGPIGRAVTASAHCLWMLLVLNRLQEEREQIASSIGGKGWSTAPLELNIYVGFCSSVCVPIFLWLSLAYRHTHAHTHTH